MTVEERTVEITLCDACRKELTSDYIHIKGAEIANVYNDEEVSTLSLEDRHFCNRSCLKDFIEAYV